MTDFNPTYDEIVKEIKSRSNNDPNIEHSYDGKSFKGNFWSFIHIDVNDYLRNLYNHTDNIFDRDIISQQCEETSINPMDMYLTALVTSLESHIKFVDVTIPTYQEILDEINKHSAPTDSTYYRLRYYEPYGYCGASIDTKIFEGDFWNSVLKMDAYLKEESYASEGFVENTYQIIEESFMETFDNGSKKTVVEQFITDMKELYRENDTLWIEKVKSN